MLFDLVTIQKLLESRDEVLAHACKVYDKSPANALCNLGGKESLSMLLVAIILMATKKIVIHQP